MRPPIPSPRSPARAAIGHRPLPAARPIAAESHIIAPGCQVADAAAGQDDHSRGEKGNASGHRLDEAHGVHADRLAVVVVERDEMQGDERIGGGGEAYQHVGAEAGGVVAGLALVSDQRAEGGSPD